MAGQPASLLLTLFCKWKRKEINSLANKREKKKKIKTEYLKEQKAVQLRGLVGLQRGLVVLLPNATV